jgi:MoaA/NifB/PqqE/SkfB family radical SAM enzyme
VEIVENKVIYYMNEINQAISGKTVFPVTCEIDPSNACNLNCSFCMYATYLRKNRDLLPWKIYCNLITELKTLGTKSITFTGGGSPLMNPRFNDMVSKAHALGFEIGLITNGTLLDRVENLDYFKFIRISLDAYDEKSYHKIKGKNLFNKVIKNIKNAVNNDKTDIGISYVICEDNVNGIQKIQETLNEIGIKYIQFKPAWINGRKFNLPENINGNKTIITDRYIAKDNLPCLIAGLVGIVGADSKVYFCCQYRGNNKFLLGDLNEDCFKTLWERRKKIMPDTSKCPQCRYQNYAVGYEKFSQSKYVFLKHKKFL